MGFQELTRAQLQMLEHLQCILSHCENNGNKLFFLRYSDPMRKCQSTEYKRLQLLVKKKLPSATNINKSVVLFLSFLSFTKANAGTLSRGAQQ
jgi:hypothetical protein